MCIFQQPDPNNQQPSLLNPSRGAGVFGATWQVIQATPYSHGETSGRLQLGRLSSNLTWETSTNRFRKELLVRY